MSNSFGAFDSFGANRCARPKETSFPSARTKVIPTLNRRMVGLVFMMLQSESLSLRFDIFKNIMDLPRFSNIILTKISILTRYIYLQILEELKLDSTGSIGLIEFKIMMSRIPEFNSSFYFRL